MTYRGTRTSLVPRWEREFKSFQQWVDKAPTWIDKEAVCIDAKGRRCLRGADFQRARDEDAFPVRFFWECEESPELAGIASAGAHDACTLADRLMSRADNPPDPEVDIEELIRMLQTEDGRTAAFRMMQEDYQDRVDAANLLRAQKLHIDRVDAKLVAAATATNPHVFDEALRQVAEFADAARQDAQRDTGSDQYAKGYRDGLARAASLMRGAAEDAEERARTDSLTTKRPMEEQPVSSESDMPVECPECGWQGRADELGPEGECGSDEACTGRPAEIADHADLIRAWEESEGTLAGPQCRDLGLIEPHPATEQEAAELGIGVGDDVWDVSEKGEAAISARGEG